VTRPLLVIDGDSFAHRSFHALPKSIRRRGGGGGGAIVGFANLLVRLFKTEQPRAVLVGWDTLDAPNFRQRLFPPYQGGRDFDPELVDQLAILPDFISACDFALAKAPGYEADDFLAAAVVCEERAGGTALVASGDRDAFQLASTRTTILHPVKAGEIARIGPAGVRERYGVDPKQVPDFIALRGDPSDKLPGARGVGPKRAAALLGQFGSLEQVLGAEILPSRQTTCFCTRGWRLWMPPHLCPTFLTKARDGIGLRYWHTSGSSIGLRADWKNSQPPTYAERNDLPEDVVDTL
jgi:DNA polymerase I